jgi:hypothetical protein
VTTFSSESPITPVLARWLREAHRASERTVIVRTSLSLDRESLAQALGSAGVDIRSSGPGVSTVRVRPDSLDRLAKVRGVIAIEEPREFFPKSGFRGI